MDHPSEDGRRRLCYNGRSGMYLDDPMVSFVHRFSFLHRLVPSVAKVCGL